MDLISREAVKEKFPLMENGFGLINDRLNKGIDELPSAFEGMTNGEVIQALFPYVKTEDTSISTLIGTNLDKDYVPLFKDWWNAPYKAESEDKI